MAAQESLPRSGLVPAGNTVQNKRRSSALASFLRPPPLLFHLNAAGIHGWQPLGSRTRVVQKTRAGVPGHPQGAML